MREASEKTEVFLAKTASFQRRESEFLIIEIFSALAVLRTWRENSLCFAPCESAAKGARTRA
jgi:hypothetical protein